MTEDTYGLKVDGYNLADDADSVLGPVSTNLSNSTSFLDSATNNRDADGNIAFPGKYVERSEPSIRNPATGEPSSPENGSSWPEKNEDGSYQIAPGAKVVFKPFTDDEAWGYSNAITSLGGYGIGRALKGLGGKMLGPLTGDVHQRPVEQMLKKLPSLPRIQIGEEGDVNAMSALDYPNENRSGL